MKKKSCNYSNLYIGSKYFVITLFSPFLAQYVAGAFLKEETYFTTMYIQRPAWDNESKVMLYVIEVVKL